MNCNNTLTDDELEDMFPPTDKEMQKIEQPMECPIERTQHKRRKCSRFFSNQAALKQHTANLPSKRTNAPAVAKSSIVLLTWRST